MAPRRRRAAPYYYGGETVVSATTATLTLTALLSSVRAEIETRVTVTTASLVLTPQAATIRAEIETRVAVDLGGLTLTPHNPILKIDIGVNVSGSPELGHTTIGATNGVDTSRVNCAKFTEGPVGQTYTVINIYNGGDTTPILIGTAVYTDNSGVPNTLVQTGPELTGATGWISGTITAFATTADTSYWICWQGTDGGGAFDNVDPRYEDTGGDAETWAGVVDYKGDPWAATATREGAAANTRLYSAYVSGVTLALAPLPTTVIAEAETRITATTGSLALTPLVATITAEIETRVSVTVASLTLTPLAVSIVTGTTVSVTTGTLTLTTFAAIIRVETETRVIVTTGVLTLTPLAATIRAEIETRVTVTTASLTLTPLVAVVQADTSVTATTDALTLTTLAASVQVGVTITSTSGTLTFTALTTTIQTDTAITATLGTLTLTAYDASLAAALTVNTTAGSLSLTPLTTVVAVGTLYYLDKDHGSASDSNAGTSASAPWLTWNKGITSLSAGDRLLVKEATTAYDVTTAGSAFGAKPSNSGTTSQPITVQAFPGDSPVTDASTGNSVCATIWFEGPDWWVVDGIEMTGGGYGIRCYGAANTSNHIFRNLTIHGMTSASDNGAGIKLDGTHSCLVQNCTIYNIRQVGDEGHAIQSYNGYNNIVEDCLFYDVSRGVFLKQAAGVSPGFTIRRNVIHDCVVAGIVFSGTNSGQPPHLDHTVYENVIYDANFAIQIDVQSNPTAQPDGLLIYNNVLDATTWGFSGYNITGIEFYDNIVISQDVAVAMAYPSGETYVPLLEYCDYNLYSTDGSEKFILDRNDANSTTFNSLTGASTPIWDEAVAADYTSLGYDNPDANSPGYVDPLFVNRATKDYHLQALSPAKGAGRYGGDIGAYPAESATTIIAATTGALTLTANTVTITTDTSVTTTLGALTFTTHQAIITESSDTVVTATLETLTLTSFNTSVFAEVETRITATTAEMTLIPLAATISLENEAIVSVTTGSLSLSPLAAVVFAEVETRVAVTTGSLSLTPLATTVFAEIEIEVKVNVTTGVLTLTPLAVVVLVEDETRVTTTTGVLTLTPLDANVFAETTTNVAVTTGSLTFTAYGVIVTTIEVTVNVTLEVLTLTGLIATVVIAPSIADERLRIVADTRTRNVRADARTRNIKITRSRTIAHG